MGSVAVAHDGPVKPLASIRPAAPATAVKPSSQAPAGPAVQLNWEQVVEQVSGKHPNIGAFLEMGSLVGIEGNQVVVGYPASASVARNMMDKPATRAVEEFVHAGYDLDAAAILLCESDGTPEEVEEEIGRMTAVLQGCGATRIEVSQDEAQRLRFWSGRKNAFPASGRISPDYMCMDSTIPRKRLADILIAIAEMEIGRAHV